MTLRALTDEPTGGPASIHLGWIQVDCADPDRLAEFWASLLSTPVRGRLGEPAQYVVLDAASDDAPRLSFQRVPEAKSAKSRLHLDLAVGDLEAATAVAVALGATVAPDGDVAEHGMAWRVMLDPEGNEFCLVPEGG